MRAAIGWTYNLLTDFGRRLIRRLSVAGGAFDIDDAEALGDGELAEVLDALSALGVRAGARPSPGRSGPPWRLLATYTGATPPG